MALPLPQPFSSTPGGPLLNAMNGIYANQTARATANYAPYQAYGNAFKTMQEAKWLPYQYQMQALSNPLLWQAAQGNPAMQAQLANMMKNTLPGGQGSPQGGIDVPPPGGTGNGILSQLLGKVGGAAQSINPFSTGVPEAPSANNSQNTGTPSSSSQDFGENNRAPDAEVDRISREGNNSGNSTGLPSSHINRAVNTSAGAGWSGVTPPALAGAQAAALTTTATGEAGNQQAQQKELEDTDSATSQDAIDQINLIKKAQELHKEIPGWQRGPAFGHLPAVHPAADEFDKTLAPIVASIAKQQSNGNVTNGATALAQNSKFPRSSTDAAFKHLTDYSIGMNYRLTEKPAFDKFMIEQGYTPQEAKILWQNYQIHKPFYDSKKHEVLSENMGSWNNFYSNKKEANKAFSADSRKMIEKNFDTPPEERSASGAASVPGDIGMIDETLAKNGKLYMATPDGQHWWVPVDKVNDAVKIGARQINEPSQGKKRSKTDRLEIVLPKKNK